MRLEFIGNIITFFAALFAVQSRETIDGGKVGLSVTYALSVSSWSWVETLMENALWEEQAWHSEVQYI